MSGYFIVIKANVQVIKQAGTNKRVINILERINPFFCQYKNEMTTGATSIIPTQPPANKDVILIISSSLVAILDIGRHLMHFQVD